MRVAALTDKKYENRGFLCLRRDRRVTWVSGDNLKPSFMKLSPYLSPQNREPLRSFDFLHAGGAKKANSPTHARTCHTRNNLRQR